MRSPGARRPLGQGHPLRDLDDPDTTVLRRQIIRANAVVLENRQLKGTLRLREDAASEPNGREANQRSAPAVERGLFLVPKVIE